MVGTLTFVGGVINFLAMSGGASEWKALLREMGLIPFGGVLAFAAFVVALLFGFTRLYAYGALVLLTFVGAHFLQAPPSANFLLPGVVILGFGVTMLVRFVRTYPRPSQEASDDTDH